MTTTGLVEALRAAAGAEAIHTAEGSAAYAADGLVPACVVCPETVEGVERCMTLTHSAGAAVIPAGHGTRLGVGFPPLRYDVAVSTRRLAALQAHDDADMTVTVDAGITLAALNAALAGADQWLPLDPPRPEVASIGAIIATGACGPLRLSQGKVRDLLIGITVVLADGSRVRGGGRVVKNVAGYDLMKLFTGSHGTLGVIVGASFKVRPRPAHRAVLVLEAATTPAAAALAEKVLTAPVAPLFVEVLDATAAGRAGLPVRAAVVVGLGGSRLEIAVQRERVAALVETPRAVTEADTEAVGAAVRDLPAAAVCGATLSVLPSRLAPVLQEVQADTATAPAIVAHGGDGVARLCWFDSPPEPAAFAVDVGRLRDVAKRQGGWLVVDTIPSTYKAAIDPWGAGVPGMALMRGVKRALDPMARLSPGRFVDRM